MTVDWMSVVELAGALVALLAMGGGLSVVYDKIKASLGLSGRTALIGYWAFSALVVLATGIAAGAILPESFSDPVGLLAMIITALTGGHSWYKAN